MWPAPYPIPRCCGGSSRNQIFSRELDNLRGTSIRPSEFCPQAFGLLPGKSTSVCARAFLRKMEPFQMPIEAHLASGIGGHEGHKRRYEHQRGEATHPRSHSTAHAHMTEARLPTRPDRLFYEWMSKRLSSRALSHPMQQKGGAICRCFRCC